MLEQQTLHQVSIVSGLQLSHAQRWLMFAHQLFAHQEVVSSGQVATGPDSCILKLQFLIAPGGQCWLGKLQPRTKSISHADCFHSHPLAPSAGGRNFGSRSTYLTKSHLLIGLYRALKFCECALIVVYPILGSLFTSQVSGLFGPRNTILTLNWGQGTQPCTTFHDSPRSCVVKLEKRQRAHQESGKRLAHLDVLVASLLTSPPMRSLPPTV